MMATAAANNTEPHTHFLITIHLANLQVTLSIANHANTFQKSACTLEQRLQVQLGLLVQFLHTGWSG